MTDTSLCSRRVVHPPNVSVKIAKLIHVDQWQVVYNDGDRK